MSGGDDSLEQIECDLLEECAGVRVAIRRATRRLYDRLDDRKQGRLHGVMKLWCNGAKLTPQMFNYNEGRTPRSNVLVQVFKTFKVRLYGFNTVIGGKRTFIIVDIDPAKKQDKADPKILARSKSRIDELVEGIEQKGTKNGAR